MSAGGSGSSTVKKRLSSTVWIGNLGSSLTEYQVLKFAQQVGTVEKFDFMYHETTTSTAGCSDGRMPRGYAFVTYANYAVADEAIRKLDGQTIAGRRIAVQPATTHKAPSAGHLDRVPKSLSMSIKSHSTGSSGSKMSKEDKIRAMERKLKALEREESGQTSSAEFKVVVPIKSTSTNREDRLKINGTSSLNHRSTASKPYHKLHQSKR